MGVQEADVFVVAQDRSTRTEMQHLLRSAGFRPQAFGSVDAPLARVRLDNPACVVLDLRMPSFHGLELQKSLVRETPHVSILFLCGATDVPSLVMAMKRGAVDLLVRPVASERLRAAVQEALQRSRGVWERQQQERLLAERHRKLTPREREVFAGVSLGMLNKQIGYRLGITEKTVKVHRGRVMEKMRAQSLADLVRWADRLGVAATPRREQFHLR